MKNSLMLSFFSVVAAFLIAQVGPQQSEVAIANSDDAISGWFEIRSKDKSNAKSCTIDGWLEVELGSSGAAAFHLWETKECLEFHRFKYGLQFDDLQLSEFLSQNYADENISWQKFNGRFVRLAARVENPEIPGYLGKLVDVTYLEVVGVDGATVSK